MTTSQLNTTTPPVTLDPSMVIAIADNREQTPWNLEPMPSIRAGLGDFELAQWRSKLSSRQVQASFAAWIAQGHRLIIGRDAETSAIIARGVLFYAARYRLREASAILDLSH